MNFTIPQVFPYAYNDIRPVFQVQVQLSPSNLDYTPSADQLLPASGIIYPIPLIGVDGSPMSSFMVSNPGLDAPHPTQSTIYPMQMQPFTLPHQSNAPEAPSQQRMLWITRKNSMLPYFIGIIFLIVHISSEYPLFIVAAFPEFEANSQFDTQLMDSPQYTPVESYYREYHWQSGFLDNLSGLIDAAIDSLAE